MLNLPNGFQCRQTGNSCIVASYAVAMFPFTAVPLLQYYEDYGQHFHLPAPRDGNACADHFHEEWQRRGISGLRLLTQLHAPATGGVFAQCSQRFDARLIDDVAIEMVQLENQLRSPWMNALLVFLPRPAMHSVAVGCDNAGLFYYDTAQAQLHRLNSIAGIGPTADGILFAERPQPAPPQPQQPQQAQQAPQAQQAQQQQ